MAMTTETLREAVARAIFEQEGYCRGDGDDPFLKWTWEEAVAEEYPVLAAKAREMADAAIRTVLERVVKLCDEYGETNMEICGDNILMDPLLHGKEWSDENVRISDDCTIMSTIHSSQYHASQHIKAQVQAMLDAAAREVG